MTSRTLCTVDAALRAGVAAGPVLGIETGGPQAELAVVAEGRILAEGSRAAASHGAELPDAVAELLGHAGVAIGDLRGLAVGIGPGSFTGLRVGMSYAKGLAMATGCALAGVPSLDTLALAALAETGGGPGRMICPVLDARKGEVYAALYRVCADGLEKLSDDLVLALENLVPRLDADVLLVGDRKAAEAYSLVSDAHGQALSLEAARLRLRGRAVAALGAAKVAAGEVDNAFALQALYVRPAEAIFRSGQSNFGSDGKWSGRKKNSSFSMHPMTKN
jgi:tRNA threonylcarbamoyladenosine biosynthesis protein TsaB